MMRIGCGFDVHAFADRRRLILGGVEVPHARGLIGHSDADVLTHAICDALLGAVGLGDIGTHFPNDDPIYKDADSLQLLKEVTARARTAGFCLVNVDSTVALEQPKLAPYIEAMRGKLAVALSATVEQVSIKATTSEKLGFVGRQEGAAAFAVALMEKSQ